MPERLLFAAVLSALLFAGYIALRWRQLRKAGQQGAADPLLEGIQMGVPTVVYFTTPNCIPCRYQQKPALAQLKAELGDGVQIIEVDAAERPDDAKRWGVFTAPTTFILSPAGTPHTVNHGAADAGKLARQIRDAHQAHRAA